MASPAKTPDSLLSRIHANAASTPSKPAILFYASVPPFKPSNPSSSVIPPPPSSSANAFTYQEALSCVYALSPLIKKLNLPVGSKVLLVYPPCPAFLFAFLALLLHDLIPVPVFPPDPRSLKSTLSQFKSIVSSSGATNVLTSSLYNHVKKVSDLAGMFGGRSKADQWPDLIWTVTDTTVVKDKSFLKTIPKYAPSPTLPKTSFLQYTSGSTSYPKGVVITHASLAHNLAAISASLRTTPATVCCSWLPQYHDMGLIGSYLGLLYCGGTGHYMSPLTFITNPLAYLRLWSSCNATHLQMPNFALRLCVKRFKAAKGLTLDLGKTQHIINAAEPIDHATCAEFIHLFNQECRLPKEVLYPTYGLAEHTVLVCSGGAGSVVYGREEKGVVTVLEEKGLSDEVGKGRNFVGCGNVGGIEGIEVRIVEPESCEVVGDLRVGEIWVTSGSKSAGYYGMEETNGEVFRAEISEPKGPERWLRTGDLGFVREGELYVSGRLKDLIIVRGRNYYPQDVEGCVESVSDKLRPGCCGCFVVSNGEETTTGGGGVGEDVGVVMEVRDGKMKGVEGLVEEIRERVMQEHGLGLRWVCLLEPKTVPKTTSGKIARAWCKRRFLAGELKIVKGGRKDFGSAADDGGGGADAHDDARGEQGADQGRPSSGSFSVDPALIRGMAEAEILQKLLAHMGQLSSLPPDTISQTAPLTTIMDSMSVSQLKGLLEQAYAVTLSDEYLFREETCVAKLVDIIKLGYAPDDSVNFAEGGGGISPEVNAPTPSATGPPGLCCTVS